MFFDLFKAEIDDTGSIKKLLLRFEFFGVARPTINAYVNGMYVCSSELKNNGTIVISESDYPELLKQGTFLQAYLTNTQTHQEHRSETLSFFIIYKADSRNGWNPQPITYISDSDYNKSMILPPVASAKGKLYHFKYLGTKRPFVLMSSLKDRAYPLKQSELIFAEKETMEDLFESTIEGTWKYQLSYQNQCVSVVSDGLSWLVVNNYEGTFTSIGAGVLPPAAVYEKTKSHFLNYYWNNDASNNIVLSDLRQNSLKFLHVHRFLPDTGILKIYAPPEVGIETTDVSGETRAYLSISLSNKAILSNTASFILSYFNKRLYILAHYDGAGFSIADYPTTSSSVSLESSLTIAGNNSMFRLPQISEEKQETKFYIIKNKSQGKFILAAAKEGEASIYTPKNGLRDCITYTKPLNKFCFWVLVYYDHQLGGQTTAILMNKYNEE
jgi:hypothetical protein